MSLSVMFSADQAVQWINGMLDISFDSAVDLVNTLTTEWNTFIGVNPVSLVKSGNSVTVTFANSPSPDGTVLDYATARLTVPSKVFA